MKSNFTLRTAVLVLGLLVCGMNVFAQPKTMYLGSATSATWVSTVSIPVMVKNFSNIVAFQASVNWDHSALTYAGITYSTTAPLTTNASNVSTADTSKGRFGLLWLDPNASGVSVPDGFVVVTLKFNVAPGFTGKTPIVFGNLPTSEEIDTIDQSTFIPAPTSDTAFIAGFVQIGSVTPVKLLNFKGKSLDNSNVLSWITANETNLSGYSLERSINGKDFSQISLVKALCNANAEQAYSFTDKSSSFTTYYRLKMIDNNGSFSYSTVVKINKDGKAIFNIQTNPIQNGVVKVFGNNMKDAKIYDNSGRLLLSQQLTNTQSADVKVANLTSGVYMLSITSIEGINQTEKFIVQ